MGGKRLFRLIEKPCFDRVAAGETADLTGAVSNGTHRTGTDVIVPYDLISQPVNKIGQLGG